jgi:prolyl oligopeptidase
MTLQYPDTPATDFVERLHGQDIADPYRWLEDTGDPQVQQWIDAQNAATHAWLADASERSAIRERLRDLWDFPRRGVPSRYGKHWFQLRNTGLQDQDVLWVADAPDAEGRVLIDPNGLSADGTTALSATAVSHDGTLLAYAVSDQGSDWRRWLVRDVATGQDLPDRLQWSKFSLSAWHPDGSGFWYGAYDPPASDAAYQEATRGQRLAFHRLGTRQEDDEVTCEIPGETDWIFDPEVTEDGRWLVVTVSRGTDPRSRVWVADLTGDGKIRPLLDAFDAAYTLAGNDGSTLFFLTDRDAPRGRVVAVDGVEPVDEAALDEVVPERPETLQSADVVGGRLLTLWLSDAVSKLRRSELDGSDEVDIALPDLGTVGAMSGRHDDDVFHFSFSSFTDPPGIYRHDLGADSTTLVSPSAFAGDTGGLVTEQVFVASADGTRIPMFLVRRADVEAGMPRPTLLTGYGGFNIPVTPTFSLQRYVWVERGGVLAVANLRGGGEYGQEWHDGGRLDNKQNVFDDAIACGEWLVEHGWTTPDRLAVQGGSNGGLLVGACLTQRPDLFGAAVAEVGVLDMLRFHLSTIGWAWKSDYGDPDDPDAFATLLSYSPYHRIEPGTAYPPTLVTTGDHDDRVVPSHSFKFAARLQAAQAGTAPVLLRVDRSGGHGGGKPTAKIIDERADVLGFLDRVLGAT